LYHARWEIETAYMELKSTLLGNRVLRSHTTQGVIQEIYALLITYQTLRIAITEATLTIDTGCDRASFTVAWQAAQQQLITAGNIIAGTVIDLVGTIGTHIRDNLLPPRRWRTSPRLVKRPRKPKYDNKNNFTTTHKITTIEIEPISLSDP
ncbi:MAG: hypothetical protein ACRER6_18795, partial [Pseudomonas sp.]